MSSLQIASQEISRAEIDRLIEKGRQLQGEALRDGFYRIFRSLVGGCSLRSLRLAGQRQPCC